MYICIPVAVITLLLLVVRAKTWLFLERPTFPRSGAIGARIS